MRADCRRGVALRAVLGHTGYRPPVIIWSSSSPGGGSPQVVDGLVRVTDQHLVAIQTVLNEGYWCEPKSRPWLTARADLVLDTTGLTPEEAADRVWKLAADRIPASHSQEQVTS